VEDSENRLKLYAGIIPSKRDTERARVEGEREETGANETNNNEELERKGSISQFLFCKEVQKTLLNSI